MLRILKTDTEFLLKGKLAQDSLIIASYSTKNGVETIPLALKAGTVHSTLPIVKGAKVRFDVLPVSKKLPEGEHASPPKGYPESKDQYADPEGYTFPIDTEKHVRAALAYFHKHRFPTAERKKKAAKRIMSAAKKHGIDTSKHDDVAQAAKD